MASLGQIIFYTMITLIIVFTILIILILTVSFSKVSSEVSSMDTTPIANLGEDVVLFCDLKPEDQDEVIRQVSITWTKQNLTGVVYQYKDGAADNGNQNAQFKGRTQLFPDVVTTGNASLLLRGVRSSDEGQYTCSITSTNGGGQVNIQLRTAAFSAPEFKVTGGELVAVATRWKPKPNVTWADFDGRAHNGTTRFTQNHAGIYSIVSTLELVTPGDVYTCTIENELVTGVSKATVRGTEVTGSTYFTFNAASVRLSSAYLNLFNIMTFVLCSYYLI